MATCGIEGPRLLTRAQAASYLHCKPQTLAIWASTGRYNLPFVRVGRLVRYRVSDLEAFLVRRTVGTAAPAPVAQATSLRRPPRG